MDYIVTTTGLEKITMYLEILFLKSIAISKL